MEDSQNLRELFQAAETARKNLHVANDDASQESLAALVAQYRKCGELITHLSLFSRNESLEDISTISLPFLTLHFHLGELVMQRQLGRKKVLNEAANEFNDFLNLLNNYQLLSKEDSRLYTTYRENPFDFSTAPQQDAAARRNVKIARFREEKQIKQKIEQLQVALRSANVDDEVTRNLYLTDIQLSTSRAFQNLESIGLEIQVLAHAPTEQPSNIQTEPSDGREKIRTRADGYSDRLDRPQNGLAKGGPILSKDGKPLQPFTLLSSRDRVRKGVFRPGHNLPTMSIDEYLEEEKRRGGIIEGGGPQSEIQAEIDEDDMDKADEETMKARDWDEFTEANHKGSGNTINRG